MEKEKIEKILNNEFFKYHILSEAESKKDSNIIYGLPEEKKFPLQDAKHVKLAVKFFNYVDEKDEEKLADAIKNAAKKFNVELSAGENNRFKKYIESDNISESVLDPIHKERCQEIFENDKMKDDVKKYIEESFQKWYDQLNEKIFEIVDYKLIGSSSGFQYTDYSDMDVQVFIKMKAGYTFNDTRKLISILPNGNNLPGTEHPINYFLIDSENPTSMEKVENMYRFSDDSWEKKTEKASVDIPINYVKEVSRFFTDGFDLVIGRYDRDKIYLEDAYKLDPEKIEISEAERDEAIEKAKNQLKEDIDALRIAEQLLHGFLLKAYDENNFFKVSINYSSDDPRFSMNNLIYKTLDRFQYREKIWSRVKEGRKIIEDLENQEKNKKEKLEEFFNRISSEEEIEILDESLPWKHRKYKKYMKSHLSGVKKSYIWLKKNLPEIFSDSKFHFHE